MTAENKMTSVTSIIFIVAIVVLFAIFFQTLGSTLGNNPNAKLSDDSKTYANKLAGNSQYIDTNVYTGNNSLSSPIGGDNPDNKNDFSLDFNFGRRSASRIGAFIYIVTNIPEYVLIDVFDLDFGNYKVFVDLLDWLWRIMIFIAIVLFIRGASK